jgi:hypothetical protein
MLTITADKTSCTRNRRGAKGLPGVEFRAAAIASKIQVLWVLQTVLARRPRWRLSLAAR